MKRENIFVKFMTSRGSRLEKRVDKKVYSFFKKNRENFPKISEIKIFSKKSRKVYYNFT